jgi:hypothetical protein
MWLSRVFAPFTAQKIPFVGEIMSFAVLGLTDFLLRYF